MHRGAGERGKQDDKGGERKTAALAPWRRGGQARSMSSRWWIAVLVALLISALTFFVSRRIGFTLLLLPLFFVWGGRPRD